MPKVTFDALIKKRKNKTINHRCIYCFRNLKKQKPIRTFTYNSKVIICKCGIRYDYILPVSIFMWYFVMLTRAFTKKSIHIIIHTIYIPYIGYIPVYNWVYKFNDYFKKLFCLDIYLYSNLRHDNISGELFGVLESANRTAIDREYELYVKNMLPKEIKEFDDIQKEISKGII